MAAWSLILGIVSWILAPLVAAIPAVVLGHLARRAVRRSQGQVKGNRAALAGLMLGYANIIVMLPLIAGMSALLLVQPETVVRVVQRNWLEADEARKLHVRAVTFSLEGLRGLCGHTQVCVRQKLVGLEVAAVESNDHMVDTEIPISISADGSVEFNEAPIAMPGDRQLTALRQKLGSCVQKFGSRIPVVLVSQDNTSCQRLVDVLTACEASGAKRVRVVRHSSTQEVDSSSYPDILPPPSPSSASSPPPPPPPEPPPLRVTRVMDATDIAALKTNTACVVGDMLWTPGRERHPRGWAGEFTTKWLATIVARRNADACFKSVLAGVQQKLGLPLNKMGAKAIPETACLRITEDSLRVLQCSHLGRLREVLTEAGVRYLLLAIYAPATEPDR